MRLFPTARGIVAVTATVLLLSGCGTDDDPGTAPATTPPPAVTETPTLPAETPTTAPPSSPTNSPTPTQSPTATPTRPATPASPPAKSPTGRGGGENTGSGSAPTGAVCKRVQDRDVATVLGARVTRSSFSGGCTFEQSDSDAPAATLEQSKFAGMKAARDDVTSAVEGSPEPVTVGDEAFVVTGTMFGGSDLQGGGAVRLGDQLVKVTVEQHQGLPRAKVRRLVLDLLRLAAR